MKEIKISEYYGYSENQGVISCKGCEEQTWVGYPEVGNIVKCSDCGCVMEFIE